VICDPLQPPPRLLQSDLYLDLGLTIRRQRDNITIDLLAIHEQGDLVPVAGTPH
jgi:hypothetical protein